MDQYLENSEYIDWQHEVVLSKANELSAGKSSELDIVKVCFEFVRDHIAHSNDYQLNPVTCKASDTLTHKTGFCYAESHLLAALLRANNIPAGLCYQRLTIENDKPPFCLHGLNAVFLTDFGWLRVDPRGNKEQINAQFSPPKEQLAFPLSINGEIDFPEIYSEPLPQVVQTLLRYDSYVDVANNLPDIKTIAYSSTKTNATWT